MIRGIFCALVAVGCGPDFGTTRQAIDVDVGMGGTPGALSGGTSSGGRAIAGASGSQNFTGGTGGQSTGGQQSTGGSKIFSAGGQQATGGIANLGGGGNAGKNSGGQSAGGLANSTGGQAAGGHPGAGGTFTGCGPSCYPPDAGYTPTWCYENLVCPQGPTGKCYLVADCSPEGATLGTAVMGCLADAVNADCTCKCPTPRAWDRGCGCAGPNDAVCPSPTICGGTPQ